MPKNVEHILDQSAVDAVYAVSANYAAQPAEARQNGGFSGFLARRGLINAVKYREQGYLADLPSEQAKRVYESKEQERSLDSLIEIARGDVRGVYVGAFQYLGEQGYAEPDRLAVVQRSRPLSHGLGQITSGHSHRLSLQVESNYQNALVEGSDGDGLATVDYSQAIRENYIRPFTGRDIGCPILAETVECPEGGRLNVYDLYWESLCDDADRQLRGLPLEET